MGVDNNRHSYSYGYEEVKNMAFAQEAFSAVMTVLERMNSHIKEFGSVENYANAIKMKEAVGEKLTDSEASILFKKMYPHYFLTADKVVSSSSPLTAPGIVFETPFIEEDEGIPSIVWIGFGVVALWFFMRRKK